MVLILGGVILTSYFVNLMISKMRISSLGRIRKVIFSLVVLLALIKVFN